MPKMSGYVKTFNVKEGSKDKSNKLMSSVSTMRSYWKSINLFGLTLKT